MFFSAGYFFLRYLLTRYFFPWNQSAGYSLLKSPIPPPPPQYHSFSFQLLVFAPFPLGKGIVLLGYQTKFALCSVSSFATHFAHLPPLKVSSRVKNHNFSKFAIFKWLNRANQELSFKKKSMEECFFCADLWSAKVLCMLIILIDRWQVLQEKLQEAVCCQFFQGSVKLLENVSSKSGLGST